MHRLPTTATNKIHRASLRAEAFLCADEVWWRPTPTADYEPLTPEALSSLRAAYDAHARPGGSSPQSWV
ncbi:MAG TPA: hypothetical protein VIU94_17450, partial [Streptomyces sp.]